MRVVTFKIDEDLLELLDRYAVEHGVSRSVAIRRAISILLQNEFKKQQQEVKITKGARL